jgi:hypothetical protein
LPAVGVHVRTSVHVTARSYTYLVNEINRVFLEAVVSGGLDPSEYASQQPTIETGLRTWMTMRQLESAYLEIYDPQTNAVRSRIDLDISFRDSGDDSEYRTDIERVRGELGKGGRFAGCKYRVLVSTVPGAASVSGWTPSRLGSVDHLTRHDVGDVIGAPRAGASMTIFR